MTSIIANIAVAAVLITIVALDIRYIIRSKKKGKCAGCPYCNSGCNSCSGRNKSA